MLVLGGLGLAVGGCALFLGFLNLNGGSSTRDTISGTGAVMFLGGCLAFILGVLWAFVGWVDRRFAKAKSEKP